MKTINACVWGIVAAAAYTCALALFPDVVIGLTTLVVFSTVARIVYE